MRIYGSYLRRWGLELMLAASTLSLGWLVYASATALEIGEVRSQRNLGFPSTYIERIHLDLASPNHYVTLAWAGPNAAKQEPGPFRSSPGAGWGSNDCNDAVESNCPNSMCTPKGLRKVEGFLPQLKDGPLYCYVTLIDSKRRVGFHAHPSIPDFPASQGCVRLEPRVARLVYDNSIVGQTEVLVDGTWTNPRGQEGSHDQHEKAQQGEEWILGGLPFLRGRWLGGRGDK